MPHSDEPYERVPAPYDPELSRLANALADLRPRARPFDRDELMFRAGQASVPPRGWHWPLAASVSSVLAVIFGTALLLRSATGPAYPSAPAHTPMPRSGLWHGREILPQRGLEPLPQRGLETRPQPDETTPPASKNDGP